MSTDISEDGVNNAVEIVVIDDNEMLLSSQVKLLSMRYRNVTGLRSLEELQHHSGAVDLIISDLLLGRDDGVEVLRYLRARGEDTPVIFVTGDLAPQTHAEILAIDPYALALEKPVAMADLITAIERALGRA